MANFRPLKRYLLFTIDALAGRHRLQGPFLDLGCGSGDVSLHFARKGWRGVAVDPSAVSVRGARRLLEAHSPHISVEQGDATTVTGQYSTIFLCDVLEHLADDRWLLQHLRTLLLPGGAVVIAVPVYAAEWRWDDDFYGHLRRYEPSQINALLLENGFEVLENWDFTFPFLWLIRRIYTRVLPAKSLNSHETDLDRTLRSAAQSAWDHARWLTWAAEKLVWWRALFAIQSCFRNKPYGCERVVLAVRK